MMVSIYLQRVCRRDNERREGRGQSPGEEADETLGDAAALKARFDRVTDAAAQLMEMGFEDIYVMTREQILDTLDE